MDATHDVPLCVGALRNMLLQSDASRGRAVADSSARRRWRKPARPTASNSLAADGLCTPRYVERGYVFVLKIF
jgi:hypothetical protein